MLLSNIKFLENLVHLTSRQNSLLFSESVEVSRTPIFVTSVSFRYAFRLLGNANPHSVFKLFICSKEVRALTGTAVLKLNEEYKKVQ